MTRATRLDVFHGDELVGSVHDTVPLAFEYAPTWLTRPGAFQVAAISFAPGRNESAAVEAFFENLLPEGELRSYIVGRSKASTLFSTLLVAAGDTAGGFVLLPEGQTPTPPEYEKTSWKALAAKLATGSTAAIDLTGRDARISLAGAQDKATIAIFADGVPRLARGTAPSTHILKPDIRRLDKVWHSAANETVVMQAATECGLPTAEVFYEPLTGACVVRRFDREVRADGSLARLVQYDMCQLAATLSGHKYEREGGPGIEACADMIKRYSTQPAIDLRHFVNWIFFNLYTGNNDSHAKNLSMYSLPDGRVMLTPFYDLMSTRVYPGLSGEFALSVGGEFKPGAMTRAHVMAMAEQLRMRPEFVLRQAEELAAKLPAAMAAAVQKIEPALPPGARTLAGKLALFIRSTTRKTAARFAA